MPIFTQQRPEPKKPMQVFLSALRAHWNLFSPLATDDPVEVGLALGRFLAQREAQFAALRRREEACHVDGSRGRRAFPTNLSPGPLQRRLAVSAVKLR